jgi:homoserine dehydrogenase
MSESSRSVRLLLIGLGNVGRRVLELLVQKRAVLSERFGLSLILVGAADSSGAAVQSAGLDAQEIVRLKTTGLGVAEYAGAGRPGSTALEVVETVSADILLEAAPANLKDGQPGLACIATALDRGMHVVTADKAPLVLAYPSLQNLAQEHNVQLRFSATVGGGLPAVNIGRRDLGPATIERLEGILNLTTNYILTRMAEGQSYTEALAQAQAAGHAETDPRLDVDGWDAASKLVILAHSVLGYPATLEDVEREGITHLTGDKLRQAAAAGNCIKPVASAEKEGDNYRLRVGPIALPTEHPLAMLGAEQMGIVYHTDINGQIAASVVEETPLPTAAAMLRDVVEILELHSARFML